MSDRAMTFAYADPPYLGCGHLYAAHHPDALLWDDPEHHRRLIARLAADYPDGWALSLNSTGLREILPMCPKTVRVASWQKSFASYKPGVQVAYTWEPVVFMGGRKRGRDVPTVRDSVSCPITLRRGLTGDTMVDLFPGSGAVGAAWAERDGLPSPLDPTPLEAWGLAS